MSLIDELAEKLARDALEVATAQNDPTVIEKVAKTLGDSSQTLQEAFMTVIRIQTAANRGRDTLNALKRGEEVDILDHPSLREDH